MTAHMSPSAAACPGCVAGPARDIPEAAAKPARLALSLPTIHCQACITKVERALEAVPGVTAARVNLTMKRALVDGSPDLRAADLAAVVEQAGFEAHELDQSALQA